MATGLTVVGWTGPSTPAAHAAENRHVVEQWNMQGERDGLGGDPESRWLTTIRQMMNDDGAQVGSLQEAGNEPPRSAHETNRRFPHPGVTEFRYNMGTWDRPNDVNIYWADTGQRRNGLAIVTRETARDAVQLPVHSRFGSRPMMGVQIGDHWYFNAHALSNGPQSPNDAEDIIETARQFMEGHHPGERWRVLADFNRSPGRMPVHQQRHIVASGGSTHYSGSELDFAYMSNETNSTVDTQRLGSDSDHFGRVAYSFNPSCGSQLSRRSVQEGNRHHKRSSGSEEECNTPVPGETYRVIPEHLDNAVVADERPDGSFAPPPTVKKPSGSETEEVQVRFSTRPGQYLLAFNDDWCLTRYDGRSYDVTEMPCDLALDAPALTGWRFLNGQIVTPDLNGTLQPSPNKLGAPLKTEADFYQWRFEPVR